MSATRPRPPRDQTPPCAACGEPLGFERPARCDRCAAERHAGCVGDDRRCACGAVLFVPVLRAATPPVGRGEVLRVARRELVAWLLALPLALTSGALLLTSERLWTETVVVFTRLGPRNEVVGVLGRWRLIWLLLAYAVVPPLVAAFARLRDGGAVPGESPLARHAEWLARAGLLACLAWLAWWLAGRA
ncbi:MAG: hypothetical protein KF878_03830 [Planctomycetes bacterium]|nr:hypothetical protein [Planctomycetota bacterium]